MLGNDTIVRIRNEMISGPDIINNQILLSCNSTDAVSELIFRSHSTVNLNLRIDDDVSLSFLPTVSVVEERCYILVGSSERDETWLLFSESSKLGLLRR